MCMRYHLFYGQLRECLRARRWPGASGLPYDCTSIGVRFWCNRRASLWIPNHKRPKKSTPNVLPTRGPRVVSFCRESTFFRNSPGTVTIPQYCFYKQSNTHCKYCESAYANVCSVRFGLTIRLVQWLGWVFKKKERKKIRSGASGLPYYCAPLVCVSDVIESLAVWQYCKPKTKNQTPKQHSTNIHVCEVHSGSGVRFGQALPGYLITAHHLYASLR